MYSPIFIRRESCVEILQDRLLNISVTSNQGISKNHTMALRTENGIISICSYICDIIHQESKDCKNNLQCLLETLVSIFGGTVLFQSKDSIITTIHVLLDVCKKGTDMRVRKIAYVFKVCRIIFQRYCGTVHRNARRTRQCYQNFVLKRLHTHS